jgi:surface antigen
MRVSLALTAIAIAASGCTTSQTGGSTLAMLPTSLGSDSSENAQNAFLAALNGGIITTVAGNTLSDRDRRKALVAEYTALESAPVGQSVTWTNERSGLSGEVSAAQAYQVGAQNCRQYTHTLRGAGAPAVAKGTACRSEEGTWTPLT